MHTDPTEDLRTGVAGGAHNDFEPRSEFSRRAERRGGHGTHTRKVQRTAARDSHTTTNLRIGYARSSMQERPSANTVT